MTEVFIFLRDQSPLARELLWLCMWADIGKKAEVEALKSTLRGGSSFGAGSKQMKRKKRKAL